MYRQDFHLQTLTCLAIAISPLCKLAPHWFGFCVRLEVQESEVRHLWHCRIWPWPERTVVEQYFSNFQILTQPCFDHLVVRYVDNSTISFSLYRKDYLQTSVSQVFTDLDLSSSPVELELVFRCVLILPLTLWVSGPAFFLVVQACFAFFIVQVSTGFLITVSLFALACAQKSFNRSDVFSTYRIFQLDETARYDDCMMIVCDKTAFKWGVTRYPRFFDHLWTCRFLPALVFPFSDPESVPDVHQIRDCVSAGSARLRMSGLKNPSSSNSNNTLKDALLNIFNLTFVRLEIASLRDHSDSEWVDWKAGLI